MTEMRKREKRRTMSKKRGSRDGGEKTERGEMKEFFWGFFIFTFYSKN